MGAVEDGEDVPKSGAEARPRQVAETTAVAATAEAGKPEVRTSQQPLLPRTLWLLTRSGGRAQ